MTQEYNTSVAIFETKNGPRSSANALTQVLLVQMKNYFKFNNIGTITILNCCDSTVKAITIILLCNKMYSVNNNY